MSYDQWVGPPLQQQQDVQVTWSGVTKFGFTAYIYDPTTGKRGVLWQQTPNSPWQFKRSDGATGMAAADGSNYVDTTARAPVQTMAPQYAPPPSSGYSNAGYDYTLAQPAAPQYQWGPWERLRCAAGFC
jgi:hypothetical protein